MPTSTPDSSVTATATATSTPTSTSTPAVTSLPPAANPDGHKQTGCRRRHTSADRHGRPCDSHADSNTRQNGKRHSGGDKYTHAH